ncbi:MAG: hypothetical protein ACREFR_17855 [Limisphaerales bacterium]
MKRVGLKCGSDAFFISLLLLFVVGCAYLPLPIAHRPLLSPAEFAFMQSGHPSRGEVHAKLGKPFEYFPGSRVSVYPVKKLIRHKLVLFLGVLPIWVFKDYDGYEIACIQFNGQDRVRRWGFTTEYLGLHKTAVEFGVNQWLAREDRKGYRRDGK